MDRPGELPPQRGGDGRHQVIGRPEVDGRGLPCRAVRGIAQQEQQPGDLDLRRDPDGQVTDSGSTDLPCRADEPPAGAVKRRYCRDHPEAASTPGLVGRHRDFDGIAEFSELDGCNRTHD